jgi:hypothetical protein
LQRGLRHPSQKARLADVAFGRDCGEIMRHTSTSRCALTESSSSPPTCRLSPALRTWPMMNENSIPTVVTSSLSRWRT